MRTAYEDNAGGLYVVDDIARQIAWGAEMGKIDKSNDIIACLRDDLTDWSNWADDNGNYAGARIYNFKDEDGRELTYADYVKDVERSETKVIGTYDGKTITINTVAIGNSALRWINGDKLLIW